MDAREKEQYLREYSILKSQGKPFFPYAIAKDGAMACVTLAVIILMSILFGAELGPKADPTTTTYTPRPEWYFFFLFELLRVVKPPELVFLATIGIPTICLVLLLLLPFIDRNPERHPLRRPIATVGRHRDDRGDGLPHDPRRDRPARRRRSTYRRHRGSRSGKEVMASSGCLGCHKIGENGNTLGPNLTRDRRQARQGRDRPDAGEPDVADALVPASSSRSNPSSSTSSSSTSRPSRARTGAAGPRGAARCPTPRCGRCSTASPASTTA